MTNSTFSPEPLDLQSMTWAVMLRRWVDFARMATTLPLEGPEGLLRASVSDIITLQAVWFALIHLGALPPDEQAVGLDRSQILIDQHSNALHHRFSGHPPQAINELIADARNQLEKGRQQAVPDAPGPSEPRQQE